MQSSFLDPDGAMVAERCEPQPPDACPDDALGDLIARIAGERVARRVGEASSADWIGGLVSLDASQLASEYGLTPHAAERIAAAIDLHRQMLRARHPYRVDIHRPRDVAELMAAESFLDHERFWCLPLNARSQLIGKPIVISIGDVDSTDAGPRPFLRAALRCGAVAAIAVHNHPSGATDPSNADIAVTRRLIAAGRAIDVPVNDHCIIAAGAPIHSLRESHPRLWS